MNELQKVLNDIRCGVIPLSELPALIVSLIERRLRHRYALPCDECGPVITEEQYV